MRHARLPGFSKDGSHLRRGLGFLLLVLLAAWFFNHPGSLKAPSTAQRSAPVVASEALDRGKRLFDTWGDPKSRSDVTVAAVTQIISDLERVPDSDPLHSTARKAADVLQPIRETLAKQAAEREQKAKARKAAEEARWVRDVLVIRQLRSSMHNPNSFTIESALRMDDGTLCLTYRATNAFNALRLGRAVIDAKRIATSDDPDRFSGVWNRLCANKTGTDISYIRRAL